VPVLLVVGVARDEDYLQAVKKARERGRGYGDTVVLGSIRRWAEDAAADDSEIINDGHGEPLV
jgi:hypothetical protein